MEIVLDLGEGVHELNTWSRDAASFGRMGFPGVFRGVWVIYTGDEYGATLYPPGITRHQIMTRLRNPGLANPALN